MVLVLVAAAFAVLLAVALFFSIRADRRPAATDTPAAKLPIGAEAAIWSILEAVPDPRNHLALTRDLTGEVRIAGTPLDPALRVAAAERSTTADEPAPVRWSDEPSPALRIGGDTIDLRAFDRAS